MKLIFLDTETTGLGEYDRLCQVAYKMQDEEMVSGMYNPPVEMGVEAMAVHHITPAMVRDLPPFVGTPEHEYLVKTLKKKDIVMVAHNAPFDIKMINREGVQVANYIDTIKIARYFLKEEGKIKKFNLQALRYSLNIELNDSKAHDASGDVEVLEALFNYLYEKAIEVARAKCAVTGKPMPTKNQIIARFIDISISPENPATVKITFGKHKDKFIKDLVVEAPDYLKWWLSAQDGKENDRHNPNLKETVIFYLTKYGKL